jgi:hypothetical protein
MGRRATALAGRSIPLPFHGCIVAIVLSQPQQMRSGFAGLIGKPEVGYGGGVMVEPAMRCVSPSVEVAAPLRGKEL